MKRRTILRIIFWFLAILVVVVAAIFTTGYFYYSKIIRRYIIETVAAESKGMYRAGIGNLSLNVLDGDLTIDRFSLLPDTTFYLAHAGSDTLTPLLIKMTLDQFRIRGFRLAEVLRHRRVAVTRIRFINPEMTVFRMRMPREAKKEKQESQMMSIPLPKGLYAIHVGEFIIENARVAFVDYTGDSVSRNSFPSCNVFIRNILVDSVHQGKKRLFNADDIRVTVGAWSVPMKNGMNRISFSEAGLSTGSGEIWLNDFHLEPLFKKQDYAPKMGFQTDWVDVRLKKLVARRLNMRALLFEGRLKAGLVEADSLDLQDYRDKRVPDRPGFKPPMPQDAMRKLNMNLRIDTLQLNSGRAVYEEQTGAVPGRIFFNGFRVTFTGITNDSLLLQAGLVSELRGTAYLMGKGKLDATVRFHLGDPRNSFTFSAQIGQMNLDEINPMLSNLLPAKVVNGRLKKLLVPQVYANDDYAQGKLLFYYNDLSVEVKAKKETTWEKIKTGVINFAANDLIINNDNPTKTGKMKTGIICFKRDKHGSIFNFFWKSVLSGRKSTMGFNSKAQKELIKAEKAKK